MRNIGLLLSIMIIPLAPFAAHAASAPGNSCITARCHAGMLKKKIVHPAAEPCETCHQQVSDPHPKGTATAKGAEKGKGKNREKTRGKEKLRSFALTEAVPKLCYQCHTAFGTMKTVHSPVKEGQCTACHDPHDSAEPKLLTAPVKDLCLSCHVDKRDHKYVHPPTAAGECLSCHDPHETANARLLVKAGAELCLACHADPRGDPRKKTVHPALEAGCTVCHDPHGSSAKRFLIAEGPALCFSCHPAIESKVTASARSVHPPVRTERGCASCHSPHATDLPRLLLKAGKDLCLDCHRDLIRKNDVVVHAPVRDGACDACHDPHGAPNEKLLVQPYSSDLYVSYTDAEFPLCFSCHDREMLRSPTTSSATGFRDGSQNLHYLHVNRKDRGKRCKACHAVHAGQNASLIATKVLFGKWNMPLNFIKTEDGGTCAPGCHQPYAYGRKTPAKGKAPVVDKDRKKRKKKN